MHRGRLSFASKRVALLATVVLLTLPALAQHYTRTDLTADTAATSTNAKLDPNLVNAWGMARSSASFWWISDNGTGLTTLYTGDGTLNPLVVKIPTADGTGTSAPTGAIFNYSKEFDGSVFLFCTEDGTIAGWNPAVDRTNAVLKVKRGNKAVYKGCALAEKNGNVYLYATNFRTGLVEVFDSAFTYQGGFSIGLDADDFDRDHDHDRDRGRFVPFNIQNVGGNLVVTYARRAPGSKDEDHGAGLGFVRIFTPSLRFVSRLQHGSFLNAPWGIAMAPSDFGVFNHRLLIGNFGDGTINAFNSLTGAFEGKLLKADGTPLTVDGLWALGFGGITLTMELPLRCSSLLDLTTKATACSGKSRRSQPNSVATASSLNART